MKSSLPQRRILLCYQQSKDTESTNLLLTFFSPRQEGCFANFANLLKVLNFWKGVLAVYVRKPPWPLPEQLAGFLVMVLANPRMNATLVLVSSVFLGNRQRRHYQLWMHLCLAMDAWRVTGMAETEGKQVKDKGSVRIGSFLGIYIYIYITVAADFFCFWRPVALLTLIKPHKKWTIHFHSLERQKSPAKHGPSLPWATLQKATERWGRATAAGRRRWEQRTDTAGWPLAPPRRSASPWGIAGQGPHRALHGAPGAREVLIGMAGMNITHQARVLSLTPADFPMPSILGLPLSQHTFFPLPPPRYSNELWHLRCQAEKPSQGAAAAGLCWAAQHMVSTLKAAKKRSQLAVNFTQDSHQDQLVPISNISIIEGKHFQAVHGHEHPLRSMTALGKQMLNDTCLLEIFSMSLSP